MSETRAILRDLIFGAFLVSGVIMGFSLIFDLSGRATLPNAPTEAIQALVIGFIAMFFIILSLATLLQYFSYHYPIPPVAKSDPRNDPHPDAGGGPGEQ